MTGRHTALEILTQVGAIITGDHIVYTSWKHGTEYVDKEDLYPYTRATSHLCSDIARMFVNERVEVVAAPAIGALILSQWVADHLTNFRGQDVLGVYARKEVVKVLDSEGSPCFRETGEFVFKASYVRLIKGKRVLVAEDILTAGGSAKKIVGAVNSAGGNVVGLGVLVNRGGVTAQDMGVPKLHALVDIKMDAWDEADCLLCKQNVPVNQNVGHGREFLARRSTSFDMSP